MVSNLHEAQATIADAYQALQGVTDTLLDEVRDIQAGGTAIR